MAVYGDAVYVAGTTNGALPEQSSSSGSDAFLRKYDKQGTVVWTRQFGTSASESIYSIVADATGVYLAGEAYDGGSYAIVFKFDPDGNQLWEHAFAGATITRAGGLAIDATGLYVVGQLDGALPGETSAGSLDAYVMKLELAAPYRIWTRQFGGTGDDFANHVYVDATGVYVSGATYGTLPGQTSAGGADLFVRKYDLNGNAELWTRQFGTAAPDLEDGIAGDGSGIYVAGTSGSGATVNGLLQKLDANGGMSWSRTIRNAAAHTAVHALAADEGGIYVAGDTSGAFSGSTNAGQFDAWLRKYDRRGKEQWTLQLGTTQSDEPFGLALDGTAIYMAGLTTGAFLQQSNAGGNDVFLTKIVQLPTSVKSR